MKMGNEWEWERKKICNGKPLDDIDFSKSRLTQKKNFYVKSLSYLSCAQVWIT